MPDLQSTHAGAPVNLAVHDQGPADAAADRQIEQGGITDARPQASFRQSGRVGIIGDRDG